MIPEYDGWRAVPGHLYTKTQLAGLDLPRRPGQIAARVSAGDYRGKPEVFDLYDIAASAPSAASAKHLEAAAARRRFTACADCGAHPDTGLSQVTGRCETCLHIESLRKAQAEAQRRRAVHTRHAAERVADPATLVVWIDEHTPPPAPSGRARKPVAHTLTAVSASGEPVLHLSYRLPGVGPRVRAVPDGAVSPQDAAAALAPLGERHFVTWTHLHLWHLVHLAIGKDPGYLTPYGTAMDTAVTWWRGDLDPRTGHARRALSPGNADRLALLLRRMAADHAPAL